MRRQDAPIRSEKRTNIWSQWLRNFDVMSEEERAELADENADLDPVVCCNLKRALCETIQKLHEFGVSTEVFGREIPVVFYDEIEESDYCRGNLKLNMKANGNYLPKEVVKFYREILGE
jgi:hypothetical protein